MDKQKCILFFCSFFFSFFSSSSRITGLTARIHEWNSERDGVCASEEGGGGGRMGEGETNVGDGGGGGGDREGWGWGKRVGGRPRHSQNHQ